MPEDSYSRGLSPRLRGNLSYPIHLSADPGSIPAPAGEPCSGPTRAGRSGVYPRACGGTVMHPSPARPRWVYPRACGGTCVGQRIAWTQSGLSPRLRGNRNLAAASVKGGVSGLSPRLRGNPARTTPKWLDRCAVYPRACGGTWKPSTLPYSERGLSPRLRGNRLTQYFAPPKERSIPAPAGEPQW